MIPGDWEVTDAQALGNQATGAGEAAFQKNLRQAFIDYGGDASKLGDYAKYIDQATIDAAQANKQSAVAQNLAAMTKSLRQQRSALAARGILSSGAATQGTTEALTGRESADYAANRAFMGGAGEGLEGLAQLRQDIAGRIASARSSAAARLAQTYPDTWEIDQAAPPPPPPPPSAYVPPPPSSVVPPTLPGETPAERALRLRSEELDRLYGLR
jgi:multidrug efflux pump subunit AcrA (membrane-fusion protein)